jgi:hypothetical protein
VPAAVEAVVLPSARPYDLHKAPSTKPSIAATASVAVGCYLKDVSIAPLKFGATNLPRCLHPGPRVDGLRGDERLAHHRTEGS